MPARSLPCGGTMHKPPARSASRMAFLGGFPRPLYGIARPRTGCPRHSISFQPGPYGAALLLRSKKSPAETRRLLLGLVGTGVRAANQAASVVRAAVVPTVAAAAAVLTVVHADRTAVVVVAVVVGPMMICVCKCERT